MTLAGVLAEGCRWGGGGVVTCSPGSTLGRATGKRCTEYGGQHPRTTPSYAGSILGGCSREVRRRLEGRGD